PFARHCRGLGCGSAAALVFVARIPRLPIPADPARGRAALKATGIADPRLGELTSIISWDCCAQTPSAETDTCSVSGVWKTA
ncbi:hypothetical protein VB636_11840, partial [Paracoccus sp. APAP_BH8]|uniref:hypothetical protein n=1 Tax=Paracoccus sp. APAP_BH8 TaxID=3110237 RepID=UPI002FD7E03F